MDCGISQTAFDTFIDIIDGCRCGRTCLCKLSVLNTKKSHLAIKFKKCYCTNFTLFKLNLSNARVFTSHLSLFPFDHTIFFILSSLHNFLVGSTQSKNSFYFVFNFITACAVLSIDKFNLQWNQLIRFLCLFLLQLTGMRLALYCVMYGWL